jgi:predicted AAA+ superfamily ATPase
MEDLKHWKKYENNGDTYYYLPEWKQQVKLYEVDQIISREKLDSFENELNKYGVGSISSLNQSAFSSVTNVFDNSNLHELPYGCYHFEWGNGDRPTRLEKFEIRKDTYFANQKLLNVVKDDIKKFLESKSIFDELGLIHKRGYLLYGNPGTGKSSFIRYLISEVLPKECQVIWIRSIPNFSSIAKLNEIPNLKVFIIEELALFNSNGDEVRETLEFLDGENSPKNSIIIANTNYPEELAQNLADRPSRFDVPIEIKESSVEESKMFFESFLKRKLLDDEVVLTGLSVAHIKEICLLSRMYNLPLQECYDKVKVRRSNFKKGFSNRDEVGFGTSNPVPMQSSRGR